MGLPLFGAIKFNTYGLSKGNLGSSSYGLCFCGYKGDLTYAQIETIVISTNMKAKAKTILESFRVTPSMEY